ncbi:uncharacterized protein PFL1_05212 [Pseudozyma flocculosa PF-1]|uniref:protein-tyrosine-phosphatase n=2 Tax=Pseudozyma flocculosa TaxID=84751 RepID=A0A5C3F693_9BASI|nr:uncharacterized protein PFL1_05212 [Pseudozyma flocculosa PF-1]EPQ27289.1 hypothetical protein PFL1_05212 [Pseudozyma flocculosa PF-1]SPO39660.1 related to Tyrosine specific protein phosphatase and dual specificity protein phosphatase [Pseudozyma flocculosa]
MDEIIPGLWIGGLTSALSIDYLTQAGVTHIISCMKQRLPPPPTLLDGRTIPASNMRQVRVDDVEQAPILAHFASCNDFISEVLKEEWVPSADDDGDGDDVPSPASGEKVAGELDLLVQGRQKRNGKWGHWQTTGDGTVLVHCQAGCSRSVAIAAAYLMSTRRISTSEAVKMIQARRARAQPNPGFMAQLELYEQVGYEIDMRHQAVRRFLMSKTNILNGDSIDDMLLSYYPSPYPSPALSQGLKGLSTISDSAADVSDMAPLDGTGSGGSSKSGSRRPSGSNGSPNRDPRGTVSANAALSTSPTTQVGEHFTRLSTDTASTSIAQSEEVRVTKNSGRLPGGVSSIKGHEGLENRGKLPKPTFSGPKLRCKACRRELAALDHVIEHQEGQGQMAFEHRKREAGNAKYAGQTRVTDTSSSTTTVPSGVEAEKGRLDMQRMFGARPSVIKKVVDDDDDDEGPIGSGANQEAKGESEKAEGAKESESSPAPTAPASSASASPAAPGAGAAGAAAAGSVNQGTAPATGRRIQSASSLSSRLPPHLAALRGGPRPAAPPSSIPGTTPSPASTAARPSAPLPPPESTRPAILHSSSCSAYFIEPMAWMSQLEDGEVSGKLSCPASKCGAKLGSWDWAGMQCGWSKVDEV